MRKIYVLAMLMFSLAFPGGCKKSSQSILPEFPKKPPKVVIGTPRVSYPYNVVGSESVLDVGFCVEKFLEDPWPPPNFDRVECFVGDRRVAAYRPADVIHPEAMNAEEAIYLGQIADISKLEKGKWYWCLSCGRGLTSKDFGPPGHNKTLTVRVWNGNQYGEDTILFDYDDAELEQAAREYIHNNMLGYPWRGTLSIERFISKKIYYYSEGTVIDDLIDFTVKWMGRRLGLTFIKTNDPTVRPLIYYRKNLCCGLYEGDGPPNIPFARNFAVVGADRGVRPPTFWGISGYIQIICHETGHAIGLPHDNEVVYWDSCMQSSAYEDHPRVQFILHAFQQRAVRMVYNKPPGYDWYHATQ